MRKYLGIAFALLYASSFKILMAQNTKEAVAEPDKSLYINNKAPLGPNPYIELPLGAIKPQGWLKEMLVRQKNGSSGQLYKLYPLVMGQRNWWLGGNGNQWKREPYRIDGLLPLASYERTNFYLPLEQSKCAGRNKNQSQTDSFLAAVQRHVRSYSLQHYV